MMKYLLLALAVTAVSAQIDDADIDTFLEADMALPCTPKPCVPVCRPVTKYLAFGSFKIPYVENVCAPDHKCLAAAAACVAKLQAAMADAHKKGLALEAASKAKNAAHASKASKDKAAAARKAEAAAAANALGLAKAAFVAAEKEAANAKAAKESASKMYTAKAAVMDARLKSYEKAQQAHKNAVAAYDGAKSEAAKAAAAYAAAVKAHCDAEAQHAAAVKNIGHGHLAQKNCAKAGLIAGKYSVSYTNGFRTTYTITSDGKVSGTGLPNAGARTLVPSTSSKCPGQPCFFLTGVHSRGKDEYIIQKSDGTLKIEHYNPGHCCTGTGRPLKGEEEEVASSEIEAENAASPEVDDVEEEQSLSRWPYVVRSGRDCIGGAFKCGHGSLHTAYRACEASRHCGAVAFRGNHFCLKHPVRHCRQDTRNGYRFYRKPHCPNYRMMAPRRVDCMHGAYQCGASYSECDAKRRCAGDRRCGGVSVSSNGRRYCLKHRKFHCIRDHSNGYTFFTKFGGTGWSG